MYLMIGSLSGPRYCTIVISSAVTPCAVAPPLSPLNGAKHSGAKKSGTATRPRVVSQRSSHATVMPLSFACVHDSGYVIGPPPASVDGVDDSLEPAELAGADDSGAADDTVGASVATTLGSVTVLSLSSPRVAMMTPTPMATTATMPTIGP